MTWKTTFAAASILLLTSITGCRSPLEQLIRGQSPAVEQAGYPTGAIVYGDGGQMIQGCPDGQCDPDGHHRWGHHGCQLNHYHWSYYPPQGLRYPPQNAPTGVVFYPYYTLKGPDDFFYTGK